MRRACLQLVALIDATNRHAGHALRWLVLVIPLITVVYGVVRRLTPWGHNGVSELQWFLFAWVFLVGAGYTLLRDEHVRVDLLRNALPQHWRHRIDLVLHAVLVLPGCAYLAWHCWFFWTHSLVTPDGPEDVLTGLQRWPLKLALFAGFVLLGLQSLAEILRRMAWLRGWTPHSPEGAA